MIEKSLITREEFMEKISEEGATYWKLLSPYPTISTLRTEHWYLPACTL
jgi:hypothetical protein